MTRYLVVVVVDGMEFWIGEGHGSMTEAILWGTEVIYGGGWRVEQR
jgi:hypothetical protein